jgi:hypothetical protein
MTGSNAPSPGPNPDESSAAEQWRSITPLLARWRKRARQNQYSHWEEARKYENRNYLLGIPTVILSAIVGTSVFAALQKQVSFSVQITVGALSIVAAVMAALQTFLGFSKRAEQHKTVAASYGAVRRRMETLGTLPEPLRGDPLETVREIQSELDNLAKTAPTVSAKIFRKAEALHAQDPDTWIEEQHYNAPDAN